MNTDNGKALGIGIAFFVVFWLTLDNLALGIALGIAMATAFTATAKSKDSDEDSDKGAKN